MPDITITITDDEKLCLDNVMVGIGTWAHNAVTNRAYKAKKELLSQLYTHCNENSITIATGVSAQIDQAYDLGLIAKAVEDSHSFLTPPGE